MVWKRLVVGIGLGLSMQGASAATFAIVDPYSIGSVLLDEIVNGGHECVYVRSSPHYGEVFDNYIVGADAKAKRVCKASFVVGEQSNEVLLGRLKELGVNVCLPGAEAGVETAERLAHELGLPSNDYALARSRRNKYEMQEQLRRSGLRSIRQTQVREFKDVLAFQASLPQAYPLVLKPLKSTGSDNVHICHNEAELRRGFVAILGSRDWFGNVNSEVLVQEFLSGVEYVVDSVSFGKGKHYVTDMWRYEKVWSGVNKMYEYDELIADKGVTQDRLASYMSQVLDALGVEVGPSHAEVMVLDNGEPCLIEVGARLAGGGLPPLVRRATDTNPFELVLASFLGQQERWPALAKKQRYERTKVMRAVWLKSTVTGIVTGVQGLEQMKAVPSYDSVSLGVKVGDKVAPAVDVLGMIGVLNLMHDDEAVVNADYKKLKAEVLDNLLTVEAAK